MINNDNTTESSNPTSPHLKRQRVGELCSGMGLGEALTLPKITDPRGNLTVAEAQSMVPFDIKRAYWVYDVPGGESRGGHAHKRLKQFVVALSGSFHVTLDNGYERRTVLLNHPWQGLLIDVNTWRTLDDFSSGAVCLVLASEHYDEDDYIYDYDEFLAYIGRNNVITKYRDNEITL